MHINLYAWYIYLYIPVTDLTIIYWGLLPLFLHPGKMKAVELYFAFEVAVFLWMLALLFWSMKFNKTDTLNMVKNKSAKATKHLQGNTLWATKMFKYFIEARKWFWLWFILVYFFTRFQKEMQWISSLPPSPQICRAFFFSFWNYIFRRPFYYS